MLPGVPFDMVAVEQQLFGPRLSVVEDSHVMGSDDDKLLLFEGLANSRRYGADIAGKSHCCHSGIGNAGGYR